MIAQAVAEDDAPSIGQRPSKPELIREIQGLKSVAPPGYSTDLISDVPAVKRAVRPEWVQPRQAPPGMVEDIMRMRAADRDTPADPAEEAEFAEALRKLVEQKQRQPRQPREAQPEVIRPVPAAVKPASATEIPLVEQLRRSARHLEVVAAEHEVIGEYEAADKAREAAKTLWQEARRVQR